MKNEVSQQTAQGRTKEIENRRMIIPRFPFIHIYYFLSVGIVVSISSGLSILLLLMLLTKESSQIKTRRAS